MRLRSLLTILAVAALCGSIAAAAVASSSSSPRRSSSNPHGGHYAGSGGSHHVKFDFHPHSGTITDFWLGGIHIFESVPLHHNSSGQAHFYYNDAHFRVTGTWANSNTVLGVVARTSDPRSAPRISYEVHLR